MDLQDRNLSLNMRGADIDLLLEQLRALHFDIPADETFFGRATRTAVVAIQERERLEPTGIVDQPTAAAITRLFDQLGDSGKISGIVASASGERLRGALIEALDLGLSAKTDAEGRYELNPVAPGRVQLRASASEHRPEEAEVLVEASRSVEQNFTLKRSIVEELIVRGRVRHQDGRPLINAMVRAFDRDLRRWGALRLSTPAPARDHGGPHR